MNIYLRRKKQFIAKSLVLTFAFNATVSLLGAVGEQGAVGQTSAGQSSFGAVGEQRSNGQNSAGQSSADDSFKKSVYSKISDLHMPSLRNLEAHELDSLQKIKANNEKALKDKNLKSVNIPPVGDVEKLRITYQIFGAHELSKSANIESKHFVVNDNVFTDLEIYCGPVGNFGHHIFAQIDKTKTCFGRTELQRFLYQNFNDIGELKQEIKKRQSVVKYLVENPDVFAKIDSQLDLIKNNEADLLWFWKNLDKAVADFFAQAYFQEHSYLDLTAFNESPKLLGVTALRDCK